MKKSDFTYSMHDGHAAFSFELAATLIGLDCRPVNALGVAA
jgi:hypothetical protein